ncbi:MAG: hypothetical protein ACE5GB_06735 [Acidimicrobiales bacterium]
MTNRTPSKTVQASALLAIGSLTLAACGGIGAGDDPVDGAAAGSDSTEVFVTLDEFSIDLSRTEFEAGVEYTFVVTNEGAIPHELMLMPTDMDHEAGDDEATDHHEAGEAEATDHHASPEMEAMHEIALALWDENDMTPGTTIEQTVVFSGEGALSFEASCHLPGHYEAGMASPITVLGA